MSCNLYNGQILDRDCKIFTEGNVPLLDEIYESKSPLDMFRDAILNGESKMVDDMLFTQYKCTILWNG